MSEIVQRLPASFGRDHTGASVPSQNLCGLDVEQMRCAESLVGGKNPLTHPLGGCRLQQNFQDGRRIHYDQRLIRSARTAAAGAGRGCTG